ncbi:MAG: type II toxin-antitoxin system Phd/YefM family antitoxin [Deltaproteobacteria bacterium]|nr:type II toxin-antitoxin system Phd/YefM family antitoxin [Deltaproteobacteria bacterium]MBM4300162.1 type II toxin-antitoxin system Phd/YefM family antitoxin [Deltaproteobacteria bacterium]
MAMLKKISAMKARQNLGQLLNEVSIRGDAYIIERAGKPLAALVDMERFQQLQEDRSSALQALKEIWGKMAGVDNQEIAEAIEAAEKIAKEENRTRSELMREALRRYIAEMELRRLQRYGLKKATELSLKEEDVQRFIDEYRAEPADA